jgi:hypothetical protein
VASRLGQVIVFGNARVRPRIRHRRIAEALMPSSVRVGLQARRLEMTGLQTAGSWKKIVLALNAFGPFSPCIGLESQRSVRLSHIR